MEKEQPARAGCFVWDQRSYHIGWKPAVSRLSFVPAKASQPQARPAMLASSIETR